MPRFTATASMGTFTVTDTANSSTVLSMAEADIHGDGSGATLAPTMSIVEIDREFGTPYGVEREMGFDLIFTFVNSSGSAKQIGSFGLSGLALGSSIEVENTYKPLSPETLSGTQARSRFYPLGTYSPLVIARGASNYNVCAAMCYDILGYNHILYMEYGISSSATSIRFEVSDHAAMSPTWFTIPDGASRRYTLLFRINDRTNTDIGPAPNAAQEWLWTVRGYQQFFRRRFGKPDYRRMGGWNGRPIGSFNSSPGTYNVTTNPRRYGNSVAANPTTNGANPGEPRGFFKFAAIADTMRGRNVPRFLIWALSGQHQTPPPNYDFRFATRVADLGSIGDGVGPSTVKPGLRAIRDRMQMGLYWGRSLEVDDSTDWDVSTPEQLDLTDPALVATAFAELDLAVTQWHAQLIGLDQFDTKLTPALGPAWLRMLQRRYLHVTFLTEQALPDYLHVIAPTFISEFPANPGDVDRPFWIQQYVNPGSETILQITGLPPFTNEATRANQLAADGYSPLAGWSSTLNPGTRALTRWRELGESAIPGFDRPIHRIPFSRSVR